jgi:hypothetical protein
MAASRVVAFVVVAAAACAAAAVHAQSASTGAPPAAGARDPGDPKAAVPAVAYSSAFRRYRPNADVEVGVWRELNDRVGRIGGWRIYGREALPQAAAPDKPASATPPGAAAPAHGHAH